ncbi:hypothetical protein [Rhizobium sp. FKL33]|uniref:hypothetical protein n=1 Tax=Rhizobium sp. FKL33 TaxID=2562307 RepID=UPI001FEDC57C|nr:hypothetical protein [Rhizobium sp. FKL33]
MTRAWNHTSVDLNHKNGTDQRRQVQEEPYDRGKHQSPDEFPFNSKDFRIFGSDHLASAVGLHTNSYRPIAIWRQTTFDFIQPAESSWDEEIIAPEHTCNRLPNVIPQTHKDGDLGTWKQLRRTTLTVF